MQLQLKNTMSLKITRKFLAKLVKDPIAVLDTLSENEVVHIIQKANYEYYHTQKPIFNDDMYDLVKEYLEAKNPQHPILKSVGAVVQGDNKVDLPYFMGSLDKIKNDGKAIEKFKSQYPGSYIVSDKLDGNSGMVYVDKDGNVMLFTRGDGTVGQDISHLVPFVQHLPSANISSYVGLAVRGELIISKSDFTKVKDQGANARNMVAGVLNAKIPQLDLARMVQFVAYELVACPKKNANKNDYEGMHGLGFKVAFNTVLHGPVMDNTHLSQILIDRRQKSEFEIDGIVVYHNGVHARVDGENPKHAFAFKSVQTMDKAEVVVTKIEWNVSKDGYMIPVVHFNPVHLAGVMIQRAHGFNGKYIKDNNLGPGSKIVIMRSGDVIPYIAEVLTSSANGSPQLPDVEFEWSKTNVDIIISVSDKDTKAHDIVNLKTIEYFFDKVDIKGVSGATISKIYNSGFKDIKSIINVTKADLLKIDGFKDKTADKIVDGFREAFTSNVDCVLLMDASNILGRGVGRKKIEMILSAFPDLLKSRVIPSTDQMIAIKGVEQKTAELFITNIPKFFEFYDDLGIKCSAPQDAPAETSSDKLTYLNVVFTGFRDKDMEDFIVSNGGKVSGSVSKNTSHVVVKDTSKDSSKTTKAKELGIPVLSVEEFKKIIKM
jgi:NAD-dependent DNA ligase